MKGWDEFEPRTWKQHAIEVVIVIVIIAVAYGAQWLYNLHW